jgi:hypothetical protein
VVVDEKWEPGKGKGHEQREKWLENPDTEKAIEQLFDYHPKFKYIL